MVTASSFVLACKPYSDAVHVGVFELVRPIGAPDGKILRVSMRYLLVVVVLVFGCVPADECDGPYVRCDDNVAVTCGSRPFNDLQSYFDLRREPCGAGFCRVSRGNAFCALDPADDSNCPDHLRDSYQAHGCVGDVLTTWRYGARTSTTTCAEGTTCFALDGVCNGEAYCVSSTTPEPLCSSEFTRCVDEQIIAYCRCGFQVEAHACENPGPRCVIESSHAVCRP
jgi:hypothetical protein